MSRVFMNVDDVQVTGTLTVNTAVNMPNASIGNAEIAAGENILATKIQKQNTYHYYQKDGTDVTSEDVIVHIGRLASGTGTCVAFEVVADVVPTNGTSDNKTVTIDLLKGSSGATFASVLVGTVTITGTDTNRTVQAATINTSTFADNSLFKVSIVAAGATGTQCRGICCELLTIEPN